MAATAPWRPLFVESCTPEEDLAKALADFEAEPRDQASKRAAALKLVRARLTAISSIRHAAKPGYQKRIEQEYAEAKDLALEQMRECQALTDSWGEAAMLLALAELHVEKRSTEDFKSLDFDQALENAQAAQVAFKGAGDPSMEAQTWLVVADVHRRKEVSNGFFRHGCTETFSALDTAKSLFQDAGNLAGAAQAKHMQGVAHSLKNELDAALDLLSEAHQDYVNLDDRLHQAVELLALAQLCFRKRRMESLQAALRMCQEAVEIFHRCGSACGARFIEAKDTQVSAHLRLGDVKGAMQVAQDWADACEDDPKQHCSALVSLAGAWVEDDNAPEAWRIAERALLVAQESGDDTLEFECLLRSAEINVRNLDTERALKVAMDAVNMARSKHERRKEAVAIDVLSKVYFKAIYRSDRTVDVDVESYIQWVKVQRTIWQELGEEGRAAYVSLDIVGMYGFMGEITSGAALAEECQAIFQGQLQDKYGEARVLLFLTELYIDLDEPKFALSSASDMRECGRFLKDDQVKSKAESRMSKIYSHGRKFYEAIRSAEKALSIAECSQDGEGIVEYLIMVADCCRNYLIHPQKQRKGVSVDGLKRKGISADGLKKKALGKSKAALNLARKLKNRCLEGHALVCHGQTRLVVGSGEDWSVNHREEALKYFMEAIDIFKNEPGSTEYEALATVEVAQVRLDMGDLDKAQDAAEVAFQLAHQSGDISAIEVASRVWEQVDAVREQLQPEQDFRESRGDRHSERPYARPERSRPPPEPTAKAAQGAGQATAPTMPSLDTFEIRDIVVDVVRSIVMSSREGEGAPELVLNLDTPLEEVGIDSLSAVAFRNALKSKLGVKLPATLLQDFPTLRRLVNELHRQCTIAPSI